MGALDGVNGSIGTSWTRLEAHSRLSPIVTQRRIHCTFQPDWEHSSLAKHFTITGINASRANGLLRLLPSHFPMQIVDWSSIK